MRLTRLEVMTDFPRFLEPEVSRRKGDEVTTTSDARFQVGREILKVARPLNTSNTLGFTTLIGLPVA